MEFTLKQARKYRGLSQKEIADKLGVSRQTYWSMEKYPDSITIKKAKAICEILKFSADQIFFTRNSLI